MQTWELYYPGASATGLYFARCRIDAAEVVWVHAAPEVLAVVVRGEEDEVVVRGPNLRRVGERYPMTRLTISESEVSREDRFPRAEDLGAVVLLPGGEAGRLLSWWNREDGREWRWQVEFYNRRDD